MNIGITTRRLADLVTTYGHSLNTFFDGDKLKSILSPEDVYLNWHYATEARYGDNSPEWLTTLLNTSPEYLDYNYVRGTWCRMGDEVTLFGGNYETVVTNTNNILIIMDTTKLRQSSDISSLRGLMDTLVSSMGIGKVNPVLLSLYVNVAAMKPII